MKLNDTQSQLVIEFFEEMVGENPECYSNGSSTTIIVPKVRNTATVFTRHEKTLVLLDWNFRKEKIHPMKWKKELTSSFIQSFLKTQQSNNEILLMDIETV
jgi:hypothetical protein